MSRSVENWPGWICNTSAELGKHAVLEDQGLECVEAQPKVVLVAAHGTGESVSYPVRAWGCRWRREVDHDGHLSAEIRGVCSGYAVIRSCGGEVLPPGCLVRVGDVTENTLARGLLEFGWSGFRVFGGRRKAGFSRFSGVLTLAFRRRVVF